jgi:membrane protein implicated in regulation of membrane protease activity
MRAIAPRPPPTGSGSSATRRLLGISGIGALAAGIALAVLDMVGTFVLVVLLATPLAAATVALVVVAVHKAYVASHRPVDCGAEGLVGHVGIVRRSLDPLGQVAIDGELWRARRSWAEEDGPPPREGDAVVVDHVRGLTLSVRRAEIWEVES